MLPLCKTKVVSLYKQCLTFKIKGFKGANALEIIVLIFGTFKLSILSLYILTFKLHSLATVSKNIFFFLLFSHNNKFEINFLEEDDFNNLYFHANNVVQYGWNKEALPVVNEKKSIIARVFEFFFN